MVRNDPSSSLRKLSRERPTFNELMQKHELYHALDDRAFAIMQGADLEAALDDAIAHRLNLSRPVITQLFHSSESALTFSAKILIGKAANLYGQGTVNDMNVIRDVRNAFAHAQKPIGFGTKEVSDVCGKLLIVPMIVGDFGPPPILKGVPPGPRFFYGRTCEGFASLLTMTTRTDPAQRESDYKEGDAVLP